LYHKYGDVIDQKTGYQCIMGIFQKGGISWSNGKACQQHIAKYIISVVVGHW
jgi:hypothetical protein